MAVLLASAGCSSAPPQEPAPTPNELVCPPPRAAVATPEPIQQTEVVWRVYTNDEPPEDDVWVLFTITPKQYENLARNTADTIRWVNEAYSQLEYYRDE